MTRVSGGGGRPPARSDDVTQAPSTQPQPAALPSEGANQAREPTKREGASATNVDAFERATTLFEKQLQALSGPALARQLKFSSVQLAELAAAFGVVVKRYPRTTRKERAHQFAKSILSHKRIGKLFEDAKEEDLEQMFDAIATQLDDSPVFAQLIEDVTDGARKITLG